MLCLQFYTGVYQKQYCKYLHQCITCNAYHPAINCFKNNQSDQIPTKALRSGSITIIPITIFFPGISNNTQEDNTTCEVLHKLWDIETTSMNAQNLDSFLVNYPNKQTATVELDLKMGFSSIYRH